MATTDKDATFDYQLLARLQQDCEYYLGHGNRAKKHLWAGDEAEQIAKMKELYEGLSEKPEWLTLEQIAQYEAAMIVTQ
ncbi:LPD11 domain-containing protein [Paraburkholderia sp. A3RO-2L]|uniref:LPD11 domain-containing protein n=1 Tax=unclassified Paraburkholderia TaxID=2615204 RepID=UPI003DA8B586